MKSKSFFFLLLVGITASALMFNACKKDDDPVAPTLVSLLAGDVDLNGATSATTMPVNPTIVATFSTEIDAATATAANIKLTQDYDGSDMTLTISVSGKSITITPAVELGTGTLYQLMISGALKSTDGLSLTELSRNFTTIGTFAPSGVIAHWTFEDNAEDVVGNFNASAAIDMTYTGSRNAAAGKAATFNGTTSIIEIPNADQLMNTEHFTLSFWVKTNSQGIDRGHFVMGLGAFYGFQYEIFGSYDGAKLPVRYELADGGTVAEDMWFPAGALDNSHPDGWQGWDFAKNLTPEQMIALLKDNWLHVTFTFDGGSKKATLYYNGEKMKSFDFNLWPDDVPQRTVVGMKYDGTPPEVLNELALGFIHSRGGTLWDGEPWGGYDFPDANHFKGQLDDIRVFHKVLTANEIGLMYNSEKP